MDEFEKIVEVMPAFDRRDPDPAKNYGVSSCRIVFILKGPKGAMQFIIGTNWYVPSAREHLSQFLRTERDFQMKPDGWDVGYHSPVPMYEGQTPMGECHVLKEGDCYYDGSSLQAEEWVEDFVAGGTEWLWKKLEERYRMRFGADEIEERCQPAGAEP